MNAFEERYPDINLTLHFAPEQKAASRGEVDLSPTNLDALDVIYIYGLADSVSVFERLSSWIEENSFRELIFLEDELGAFKELLLQPEARAIIKHAQVHLKLIDQGRGAFAMLTEYAKEFPLEKVELIACSNKDRARAKRMRLHLLRKTAVSNGCLREHLHHHQLLKNVLPNLLKLADSFDAGGLRGKFKDVPVIICGAGPSLQMAIESMKKLKGKALILAGGSALAALSHAGVRPDLGIAIDPNPEEVLRLKANSMRDVPAHLWNAPSS